VLLSSVITDLLGVTGYRVLKALAEGETDPAKLVSMEADNLKASKEQLAEAVSGPNAEASGKTLQQRSWRAMSLPIRRLPPRPLFRNRPCLSVRDRLASGQTSD